MIRSLGTILVSAAILLSGCTRRASRAGKASSAAGIQAAGGAAGPEDEKEASLRGKSFQATPDLGRVHFDYDRAELSSAAQDTLARNAAWLLAHLKAELQIEGHCDQRGTTEYNLALGQRRALVVRDFYRAQGVSIKRMSTISYGEERPECEEATEGCWRSNRRAVMLIPR